MPKGNPRTINLYRDGTWCDAYTTEDGKAIEVSDRRGRWTLNKDGSGTCSECGHVQHNCWDVDNWDNFCHFCGADMR